MSNDSGKSLYVIVAGCGRLGSYIANRLSEAGHSVVIIDPEENAFSRLSDEFSGFRVEGDGLTFPQIDPRFSRIRDSLWRGRNDEGVASVGQVDRSSFWPPQPIQRSVDSEDYQRFNDCYGGYLIAVPFGALVELSRTNTGRNQQHKRRTNEGL